MQRFYNGRTQLRPIERVLGHFERRHQILALPAGRSRQNQICEHRTRIDYCVDVHVEIQCFECCFAAQGIAVSKQWIGAEQDHRFDRIRFAGKNRVVDFGCLDETRIGVWTERVFFGEDFQKLLPLRLAFDFDRDPVFVTRAAKDTV